MSITSAIERRDHSFFLVDQMSPDLRECVHEYGLAIVEACLQAGVKEPRKIRQLVREIWDGARQPRQRRSPGGTLDWLLIQAGAEITAAELARVLWSSDLVIAPICPTQEMLAASMGTVSDFTIICSKQEKHRRRLVAAMKAAASYFERWKGGTK